MISLVFRRTVCLTVAIVLGSLASLRCEAMIFKSAQVAAQWDTWAYYHEGTYYLYYLITEHSPGEGFGVATSTDGVHWKDHGWAIRESKENTFYLGTGSVWKALDFETSGRFICNYSEHRRDAAGKQTQNILFAWSTDLIHWNKFDDETMFRVDSRYYDPTGRWDCIFPILRKQGGYFGTWTATDKKGPNGENGKGIVGIGFSEDGLRWNALPTPVVKPGVSESGAFYEINDKIHAMFGASSMWAYSADEVIGPYRRAPKNARLIARRNAYFCRFLPTPNGILVNHHCMSGDRLSSDAVGRRREVTFVAPFKLATVDKEDILRWKYWPGNEVLKGDSLPLTIKNFDSQTSDGTLVCDQPIDMPTGFVLEAIIQMPQDDDQTATILLDTPDRRHQVTCAKQGIVSFQALAANTNKPLEKPFVVDRETDFGEVASLRILVRAGMMEVYLDDHFIECWTMGCHAAPQVKLGISHEASKAVSAIKLWRMSLSPAETSHAAAEAR